MDYFAMRAWSLRFVPCIRRSPNPLIRANSFLGASFAPRKHAIRSFAQVLDAETLRRRTLLQKIQEGPPVHLDEPSPSEILSSFANLDHRRAERTLFPEVVFAQGKTPAQVAMILEAMAEKSFASEHRTPIFATR
jgi:hypothetical protein